jgi:tight adherence protein C
MAAILPPLELVIEAIIFLMVVATTFAIAQETRRLMTQRRRLGGQEAARASSASLFLGRTVENRFFQWVQASTSISDGQARQKLRHDLAMAGFDHAFGPIWYVIIRFALAIGLPLSLLLLLSLESSSIKGPTLVFVALAGCGAGLLLPSKFVARRAAARRKQIEFEFPDALDLMVVCVEAGLGLDATFIRVGEEVRESHPRISHEFRRLSDELRAGRSRADAMRTMAERTGVAGIKAFVALVIQTDALGASIAQTLRTYSSEMRETRFLRAEERAMRIPVLMTIPLVTCILPVIVTALLLPVIIDVTRTLVPALLGKG